MSQRYFIQLSYRGTAYHGWQFQPNGISVQEVLEQKLSMILKERIAIVGSGRTDAGVHAEQQFAHFDSEQPIALTDLMIHALNCMLPPDIAIQSIFPVDPESHARFSATTRYYQYRIRKQKSPFLDFLVYVFRPELDIAAMNEAAGLLLKHTDFESFSKVRTKVSHFRCVIHRAEWIVENDQLVFHIKANRFLYGMVRTLVGTMLEIGQGRMTTAEFERILLAKDRRQAGRSAPASGLFLVEVGYPAEVFRKKMMNGEQ
ncbi:tRNA pseudouridine(38-40) synthase TruA [Larkinella knui]|uniref:tRNA pseudouridine synthase A n=1 Tax=Larkinella knui TaxID=2025310 RepID=A0A3P1CYH7_9BACT|nr:tRNA pseudouridine(38-40) synthase TruA [Larkinella knui]RRB18299.1 tRNA pseudouridine(38-40) synthase TruA [Larkinella knui]